MLIKYRPSLYYEFPQDELHIKLADNKDKIYNLFCIISPHVKEDKIESVIYLYRYNLLKIEKQEKQIQHVLLRMGKMHAKYITTRDNDQGILEVMQKYGVKIEYCDDEEEDREEEHIDKIEEEEIEEDKSYPEWMDNGEEPIEKIWKMEEEEI